MEIRGAILKAADWIEGHPEKFNFMSTKIPPDCGTPGCALGWIGFFADVQSEKSYHGVGLVAFGSGDDRPCLLEMSACQFYDALTDLNHSGNDWTESPVLCACLRAFADKYHPAPIVLPNWNALASEPLPVADRASALI